MQTKNTTVGSSEKFVSFVAVQKSYDGEELVVKELNLDVDKGEFLTLLGPSGSGKTTVLMMLAGFEVPTSGEVLLDGVNITKVPPHKRGVGMVFQNYALFPHMTIGENLAYPLKVRGLGKSEREEKVQNALDMVRLNEFGNRRPAQLSGGQQQRVAVARALVFEPNLVLMDEPLGALDKNLREEMQYEIKHIHENLGVTMVYVTHDQSEALTMSTRVAVFNDGIIQQLASPDVLYEHPKNAFVAGFIGENNRLEGVIESLDGDLCMVKVGENKVKANNVFGNKVGDRTSLSIRPERIVLLPDKYYDSIYSAIIKEKIYLGDHIRLRLSVLGSDEFIVKVRNAGDVGDKLKLESETKIGWVSLDCHSLDV